MSTLPDYVVADVNNLSAVENTAIRKKAIPYKFPLGQEEHGELKTLVDKFDSETGIAGLAAPQIGVSKRAFVFAVTDCVAKRAKCQVYPKSVLLNPSYYKVNDEVEEEYEQCFSVKDMVGPVKRYKTIYYKAHDTLGKLIEGVAIGYPARIIQHETDHLDGRLFVDLVPKGKLITYTEYLRMLDEY